MRPPGYLQSSRLTFDSAQVTMLARKRPTPMFVLFSDEFRAVAHSPNLDPLALSDDVRETIERGLRTLRATGEPLVEHIEHDYILRFVQLVSNGSASSAVFFERVLRRRSVDTFIAQAALSKREAEVFRLVLRSCTSAEIARELAISESTVGDHMKSIHRKTQCTRRSELIARAYAAEETHHDAVATTPGPTG